MFHRVDLSEVRAGDILVFKRGGPFAAVLSWLIWKLREPVWDRWGWHMAPMISSDTYLDAQMPRLKKASLLTALSKGIEIHAYRPDVCNVSDEDLQCFINDHVGRPYDMLVYLWTAMRAFGIPIPRFINKAYTCWELAFDAMDYFDCEIDHSGFKFPFITDFLKAAGELK